MPDIGPPGDLRRQTLSRPEVLRSFPATLESRLIQALLPLDLAQIGHLYAFGCGDSYFAPLSSALAFQQWARLPVDALPSLAFSRYSAPFLDRFPETALAVAISVSGEVSRTLEGARLAAEAGAHTLAITFNPESNLGRTCHAVLDISLPDSPAPRVRAYLATQLALFTLALHIGQLRGVLGSHALAKLRAALKRVAEVGAATHSAVAGIVLQLAQDLQDQPLLIFTGSGPNLGSAHFAAAKVLEAAGVHAFGQELEEWVHLQRFARQKGTPTFLIAPPGLGYGRAVEVARVMKQVGTYLIAVVREDDQAIAPLADVVLPVSGDLPEALTPLVYGDALELFADALAELRNEEYFRGFKGRWSIESGEPTHQSQGLSSRTELPWKEWEL